MILKFDLPVNSGLTGVGAGSVAVQEYQRNKRYGVIYNELYITKAAGGAGVTSLPLLTDVATLIQHKIGGVTFVNRKPDELIAINLLQDKNAAGSVQYFQDGALVATVNNANNASYAGLGLAQNKATTAVFQVPTYLAEYYRDLKAIAEMLALPTVFSDGSLLKALTTEVTFADNEGAVFSGHDMKTWVNADELVWPAKSADGKIAYTDGQGNGKPFLMKKPRFTKQYSASSEEFNIGGSFNLKDTLCQFSLLTDPADPITRVQVLKNGKSIKNVTKARNDQRLLDAGMNPDGIIANRFDIVFDLNDDPSGGLPLNESDELEVLIDMPTANAVKKEIVILPEYYGQPDSGVA
jgi:hypothetical protein